LILRGFQQSNELIQGAAKIVYAYVGRTLSFEVTQVIALFAGPAALSDANIVAGAGGKYSLLKALPIPLTNLRPEKIKILASRTPAHLAVDVTPRFGFWSGPMPPLASPSHVDAIIHGQDDIKTSGPGALGQLQMHDLEVAGSVCILCCSLNEDGSCAGP
jgi:hypothetical protein